MLESLFNKVIGLQACKFIKKRFENIYLSIAKLLKTRILKNICKRLLLTCAVNVINDVSQL